ncbi:MAG: DNA mismatch repair endonuclease MutL [Clostridia bacterium]|nr:DNA mismatch repair endonuclease MutL [Clostridia bacterium]
MAKIKVLDKSISNRISAGEVVEKPASVVKELIENSIDAGATSILIEIEEGGTKKIAITDNGVGIEKDDVKLAFLPHSTSKIKSVEDLENIATLGFRGEALASISAVSQIELITKTKEEKIGTKIQIEGGEVKNFEEVVANTGTKIVVNNLFFNTPARQKFLRKPKTEESEITNIIEKFLLAKPNLKIKYIIDGKLIYNTMGSGMQDNIYTIYGNEIANNLIKVNFQNSEFLLQGYIGKPEISKPNRTYQTLMINDRIVINFLVNSSIQNAFENYLMKGKFPFFVLNLILPLNSVDVNVHPSKQEVKFENTSKIYTFFNTAINDALVNANHIKEIAEKTFEHKPILTNLSEIKEDEGISFKPSESMLKFNSNESKLSEIYLEKICPSIKSENTEPIKKEKYIEQEKIADFKTQPQIIGTVFNTYILVQKANNLYFVDQHACHERKIFDNFIKEINNKNIAIQDLLLPYTFSCNALEFDFFIQNKKLFENLGFFLEPFGNRIIKITKVPFLLINIDLQKFVDDIKADISIFNQKTTDILKDYVAKKSCKSAVKAGDILTPNEIGLLIENIEKDMVLLCPHGRPIVIKITKNQLEKWFKRIV